MRYEIRPLGTWLEPKTDQRQSSGRFRAKWQSTLDLLAHETDLLGASLVIIQIDVTDGELRRDGMLRANARVGFDGVRVAFDSRHGPLTYATDAYEQRWSGDPPGWQANVRAIALALEALRAVDRYGVTRRGEQYRGWTAIGATPAAMTLEQAAEFIAAWAYPTHTSDQLHVAAAALSRDPAALAGAFRLAAARAHPDKAGGDHDTMARLNTARDLLTRDNR
jgi:hypothetical protein